MWGHVGHVLYYQGSVHSEAQLPLPKEKEHSTSNSLRQRREMEQQINSQ